MFDIRKIKVKVRLVMEPDEDGYYVYCPELKGLHVGGDTQEEAIQNGRDAAAAYLLAVIENDEPIPVGILQSDNSLLEMFREWCESAISKREFSIEELELSAA